jgi:alcohol-forming fatty acyl-CoA reductase
MKLPMTLATTSPGQIGAFFDLDGTLLPPPSLEWRFIAWLAARDKIDGGHLAAWLGRFARKFWRDPYAATFENKFYLRGLRESLVAEWEASLGEDSLRCFAPGVERIARHQAQGHRVFLVTGALGPLARAMARRLPGSIETCATELDACDGRWTGRLAGEHLRGEAKAGALRRLAGRHGLDLGESYAYGNSLADMPMLQAVGHAVAVNPEVALERVACSEIEAAKRRRAARDWRIRAWKATGSSRHEPLVSASESR